ncbi:MAG: UbiD family decarboxylase, partial [Acidimicrobiia bacterium]
MLEGDQADLTSLPVHVQHDLDGGPYISASIDFALDPSTGSTNIGFRRMMLRGRRQAGINLHSPSDLRAIYQQEMASGRRLPVSFVVGSHPVDSLTAVQRKAADELSLLASFRGGSVPVVKCVTNDIRVPADAEIVLEGYLDEHGYSEAEGPFGEFMGYYGRMKNNPVFHLTAITKRADALFQTVTISGRHLGLTDTAIMGSLVTETTVWEALRQAVREPVSVFATESGNGTHNVRVSLRQRSAGEARNAIAAVLGSVANVKHVFVVDDDIDIFNDHQMEWALSTRFLGDRDLVVMADMRVIPLDPSLDGSLTGSKVGFDLTFPLSAQDEIQSRTAEPVRLS